LENISASQNVQNLKILSPEGVILTSSSPNENGKTITESAKERLSSFFSDKDAQRLPYFVSREFIQEYRPIKNGKECYSCHAPINEILGVLEMTFDYSLVFLNSKENQTLGIIVSLTAFTVLTLIILRLFEKIINRYHPYPSEENGGTVRESSTKMEQDVPVPHSKNAT
jgi:hypothetical protein